MYLPCFMNYMDGWMDGLSRQIDGSRSLVDTGSHKSTKTMNVLDGLSGSDPAHPLSPTYLNSKGATTNKLRSSHQWQTGGHSRKG